MPDCSETDLTTLSRTFIAAVAYLPPLTDDILILTKPQVYLVAYLLAQRLLLSLKDAFEAPRKRNPQYNALIVAITRTL